MVVEGNNPAENHPMGMKWILEAQKAGAKLVVVDPRFTRTAAHADEYLAIRPGTDIAFVGALIRLVIERGGIDRDYLETRTNAPFLVSEQYSFEGGLFSGIHPRDDGPAYETMSWGYRTDATGRPLRAPRLEDEGTVFSHLVRHFSRYDLTTVEAITGIPAARISRVADLLVAMRPGVIMYALGATQHTVGVQQIRAYAILQLLLGNVGVPGGGVGANRGESNVQGATDMAVLWDKLPGYVPQPLERQVELDDYARTQGSDAAKGLVNLLKAWFPGLEPRESYRFLPRLREGESYSLYELQDRMRSGRVRGLLVMGQNPLVSNADRRQTAASLAALETLVVLDIFETETACFWKLDRDPALVATEVWLLPAAGFLEKPGSLTNSGRWVQGREVVVPPPGSARPDLWILDRLHAALKALVATRRRPRDRALLEAAWSYGDGDPARFPETFGVGYEPVLAEIAGRALDRVGSPDGGTLAAGEPLPGSAWLRADGTTACGNRLYAGLFAGGRDRSRSRERVADDPTGASPGWAWAWPDDTRILYEKSAPVPFPKNAEGVGRLFAAEYSLHEDGKLVRSSQRPVDGPLPEHFEPLEGPLPNPLHPGLPTAPLVVHPRTPDQAPLGDPERFPHVLTTGFLHEMWGGGAMSRRLRGLVEAQPEPFVEISGSLARQLGIGPGDPVDLSTARGSIRIKAVVTDRLRPLYCMGRFIEVVWAPMHYGELGDATGVSVNRLTLDALEPNVKIQETKACRCRIDRAPVEV